ncbi:MAG TPA: exonuclease domain-containing protein [Phnomibacter sp.]|nr:exonuclease domain-containing protein [Phnomibacter sp.]
MFAVVDIETTGGTAANGGITEIAILLHDGKQVEGKFTSLVNPQQKIPRYITALTGITDYMLADAPVFADIAPQVYNLLKGRVFVAHNVNFDYSFVLQQLAEAGFNWQAKKLCTVRYARKVVPGRASYSLGNICRDMGIDIENRHRAEGDAAATVQLLEHLMGIDEDGKHLQTFLKGKTPETYLPMHVPAQELEQLPYCAGVYYFKDKQGKIVYVGKAKNLKYRVRSHFANNSSSKRKQDFIRNIFNISYQPCISEIHALVLEEQEIKRLWPLYNRSQKRYSQLFGLYSIEDQRGLTRLLVEKRRKHLSAIASFHQLEAGYSIGRKLMYRFDIDERLLFATGTIPQSLLPEEEAVHNQKMAEAIQCLREELPSLAVYEWGEDETGKPQTIYYSIQKGCYVGMGICAGHELLPYHKVETIITAAADNDYIKAMLFRFATTHPGQVLQQAAASM